MTFRLDERALIMIEKDNRASIKLIKFKGTEDDFFEKEVMPDMAHFIHQNKLETYLFIEEIEYPCNEEDNEIGHCPYDGQTLPWFY